jgi:ABC-type transport system involved in multi-copper enzyme maturation permease subunit
MSMMLDWASPAAISGYVEIWRNTLSGILRSRVLYLIVFLTIVIVAFSISPFLTIRMATEAGEALTALRLQAQSVGNIFIFWAQATFGLALFLGATAISSEVKAKTIVAVLAKPIDRWSFFVAKWFGLQTFLLAFFSVGILVVATVIVVFHAHVYTLFWLGVAKSFLTVMILGTAAMALATVASPVFSGGLIVLLSMLSGLAGVFLDNPSVVVSTLSKGLLLLMPASMPASMPDNLLAEGFSSEPLNPEWSLYFQVLVENAGYTLVLLGLACVVFSSRELRLK